jgi:hypothetical protein
MKNFVITLFTAAAMVLTAISASAQVQVLGVGASTEWQSVSLGMYGLAGGGAGHYTAKNSGEVIDNRDASIVPQLGNLAVIWNSAQTQVWVFLSVDATVGNRAYFSQPRATLALVSPLPAAGNLISSAYWGSDASTIPSGVQSLINGQPFNVAFTGILPADALFAQNRVNCGTGTTATIGCLGYGTSNPHVGTPIQSAFSTSTAQPVQFSIYGTDPITGDAIPNYTVVPIGIAPQIIIANRTNASGLGQVSLFSDITYQATAQLLWTGTDCSGTAWGPFDSAHNFKVYPLLREPLAGDMNVFEYNFMVQNLQGDTTDGYFSQESIFNSPYFVPSTFGAIQPATNNPLNGACPGGSNYASSNQGARKRALSASEMVSSVKSTADSIGYLSFAYATVASIAGSPSYGYLTYQTVDPINPSGSYTTPYTSGGLSYPGNGELPVCTAPCPITPGASFPNIRNGAYRAWTLLRGVADAGSTALTNLTTLATAVANELNGTQPDYLPFNATTDGDPGFIGYRSHFAPGMTGTPAVNFNATNTPNNGITTPTAEAGGDVGGCLDYKTQPTLLNCRY